MPTSEKWLDVSYRKRWIPVKHDRSKSRRKTKLIPKGKGFGHFTGSMSQLASEHKTAKAS